MQALLVFRQFHVDEIDNNDSSDIAQSELPCNFFGSLQVGLQCVLLLVTADTFIPAVHIDDMKCLGVFYDEVCATGQIDCFSERSLHLFCHPILIENRRTSAMQANDFCLVWGYFLDVAFCFREQTFVIDHDFVEIFIQQIAKDAGGLRLLAENFCRCDGSFQILLDRLPALEQILKVFMQLCRIFTLCSCSYDDAKVFGLDGFYDLLQPASFFR